MSSDSTSGRSRPIQYMRKNGGKFLVNPFSFHFNFFTMSTKYARLGCGIDVSSKKLDVCFGGYLPDGSFKVIATKKTFNNTAAHISSFIAWVRKLVGKHDPSQDLPFQLVMETTGTYHENVLAALHHEQLPVCLERADRAKKFLQSLGQFSKNDRLDARGLCRLACERQLRRWKPFSANIMELRGVLRQRNALVKSRTRYKNQLHAVQAGHYANKHVSEAISELIRQINEQIKTMEEVAIKLYNADEHLQKYVQPILTSFKGVGMLTLLTVFAETNGFDQIKSRRALSRYAGLNVIENQSGFTSRRTKISKRGNARIRAILYMCAIAVIRGKDGPLYAKYLRIAANNPKAKKVAVVALMREILEMILTLYKSGKPYDPNHVWEQRQPKADSPSTAKESAPKADLEAHGIAACEQALPTEA